MKSSRRTFARTLAGATAAIPLVPQVIAQQDNALPVDDFDLDLKVIDVKMSDDREKQIKASLQNIAREIHTVRAFSVKRETEPATGLGVFDV